MKKSKPDEGSSRAAYYRSLGILDKWHEKTIDDFVNDPMAKNLVKKYLLDANYAKQNGVGLYLHGEPGVGKTHLLAACLKGLIDKGFTVKMISFPTMISKFTDSWYSKEDRQEFNNQLLGVDFLAIEEIGKEVSASTGGANLPTTVLDNVLRYRLQSNKPTLITSNIPASKLKTIYSDYIASMLSESMLIVNVKGEDFRVKIQEEIDKRYY